MNKIVITGFMGSGKSSVAKALANVLKYVPVDLDEEIERQSGRSPRMLIDQEGEHSFREIEHKELARVIRDRDRQVIALGGGAWLAQTNRDLIKEQGATSVWLDAPFELCWKRIAPLADERPLARTKTAAFRLFSERTSCYQLADLRVVVGEERSAAEIAKEIANALRQLSN